MSLETSGDLTCSQAFATGTLAGINALHAVKTGFADYNNTLVLVEDAMGTKNFEISPLLFRFGTSLKDYQIYSAYEIFF